MLRLASTRMSEEVTRHKVIQSDDIPVDNGLASKYTAAALISETSHFLLKKKMRTPLVCGRKFQSLYQTLTELSSDDLNVTLTLFVGLFFAM